MLCACICEPTLQVLSLEDPKPQPPTFTTAEMMRQFAHEAEVSLLHAYIIFIAAFATGI